MSPLELALKKQRLQFKSAALRSELGGRVMVFAPLLDIGDKVHDGALWLRRHPEVVFGAGVALLVARPRVVFRWTRRSVVVWQAWGRLRAWLEARRAAP